MSEQTQLLFGLGVLTDALKAKSDMTKAKRATVDAAVRDLANRCHFNCGWHMASPDKPLAGSAATTKIAADISELLEYVLSYRSVPKKAGRKAIGGAGIPTETLWILKFWHDAGMPRTAEGGPCLQEAAEQAFDAGHLDKKVDIPTHKSRAYRRVSAIDKKAAEAAARPQTKSNVLNFRSRRNPKTK